MAIIINQTALKLIKRHEGLSLELYRCPAGFNTIGYGRNLDANGITLEEAETMLAYDVIIAERIAKAFCGEAWDDMNEARQAVIIDMAFNLGAGGLNKFIRLKEAIRAQKYVLAGQFMSESLWFKQVKSRAKTLVSLMISGVEKK